MGGLLLIPGWGPAVAIAGSFIPASIGLDALRQLTLGSTAFGGSLWIFNVTTELEILVGMAVLFFILARHCLAYLETLAERDGELTSRHQLARTGGTSRRARSSAREVDRKAV